MIQPADFWVNMHLPELEEIWRSLLKLRKNMLAQREWEQEKAG